MAVKDSHHLQASNFAQVDGLKKQVLLYLTCVCINQTFLMHLDRFVLPPCSLFQEENPQQIAQELVLPAYYAY